MSGSFTGPTLWSVLGQAGLTAVPGARNSTLRDVVVATGSDGYKAAFSGGELDPRFGGSRAPVLAAYAQDGQPLGADGFARAVVPGDAAGGRYVSNLAAFDVVQAPSNPSRGGGASGGLTLSGLVARPGTYDAAALAALPATTERVTYTAAGQPVSAGFTGVSLWTLLTAAGLVTDPAIKNDELRFYVLATGSDGYEAAFSLGELDPRFGGGGAADLVAYAQDGQPLGTDGFARLVVPGDLAGGRYVSNLVSLQVIDAAVVPEPGSLALLLAGLAGAAWRRRDVASMETAPLDRPTPIRRRPVLRRTLAACLLACLSPLAALAAEPVAVFAAASLTDAMRDVSGAWQAAGHAPLRLTFAASSTLARQVEQGAPANLFASADQRWMDYLAERNLVAADTRRDLLANRLVLVVPKDQARQVAIGPGLDLTALLGPGGRIATGDPAHVPAGLYAKQALTALGLWSQAEPRLARTEDVRGALLLVERGEAPAGIVYATDAAASAGVAVAGTFPEGTHEPVTYPFAVTRDGDTPEARALLVFLAGPEARAAFERRGFMVLGAGGQGQPAAVR